MGWERGNSAPGEPAEGAPEAPTPIEVELVEEDVLPEDKPNTATSGAETIRGGSAGAARLPRLLRALAALAAGTALTIALWPGPGRSGAAPRPHPPAPASSHSPTAGADLDQVRVAGATLSHDTIDHAVVSLALANAAPTPLVVVNAELWDAIGTRIGYSAQWPAASVDPGGTVTVPLTLPYACSARITVPVVPMTIRYSISAPQDLTVSHNYEYPLTEAVWEEFMQARAGLCAGPAGGVFAASIDTVQPLTTYHDRHGFDLMITFDAVGLPGWRLEGLSAVIPGITVGTSDLPEALAPGQAVRVRTHWHFTDCLPTPTSVWTGGLSAVEVTTRATAGASAGADSLLRVFVQPELLTKMLQAACAQ